MQRNSKLNRRQIFYTLCLAYTCVGFMSTLLGASLLLLAAHTAVPLDVVGWILTTSGIGFTISGAITGYLGEQINPKYLLIAASVLLVVSTPLIAWVHIFWILLLAGFVFGLGCGSIQVSVNLAMTLVFVDNLGEMLSKMHASYAIGSLFAPLLLSVSLVVVHDSLWAFLAGTLLAALTIVALTLVYIPMREKPSLATQHSSESPQSQQRSIFLQVVLWLLALLLFLEVAGELSFSDWIASALSQGATVPLAVAAPAATLFSLGELVGRLSSGQILRKALLSEQKLLYLCLLGGGLSCLVTAGCIGNIWISFVASLCVGIFFGPIFPGVMAITSRRFADTIGRVSSLMFFSAGSAGLIFPVLLGIMIAHIGTSWGLLLPAFTCLLNIVPFYLVTRRQTLQLPGDMHTMEEQQALSTITPLE